LGVELELRERILEAFAKVECPPPDMLESLFCDFPDDIRDGQRAGVAKPISERHCFDMNPMTLSMMPSEYVLWVLPTFLLLAAEVPLSHEVNEEMYIDMMMQFLDPNWWDYDEATAVLIGREAEGRSVDWHRRVLASLNGGQCAVIVEVLKLLKARSDDMGEDAERMLRDYWETE